MNQAQVTLSWQEGRAAQRIGGFRTTTDFPQTTFKNAQETLSTAKGIIDENSSVRYELRNTLEELSAAARSIRHMAEYLERHPEALIHGKGESREN
jgi:paraquat-inducible protein B